MNLNITKSTLANNTLYTNNKKKTHNSTLAIVWNRRSQPQQPGDKQSELVSIKLCTEKREEREKTRESKTQKNGTQLVKKKNYALGHNNECACKFSLLLSLISLLIN